MHGLPKEIDELWISASPIDELDELTEQSVAA
jgi:hypothetical protein